MMKQPQVAREQMPQVDEKDIPRLLVFIGQAGHRISAGEGHYKDFVQHQDVDWNKANKMPGSILAKPIIVTNKFEVIDGNHRLAGHKLTNTMVPYIKLDISFVEALNLLNVFPFAYELTSTTPERN